RICEACGWRWILLWEIGESVRLVDGAPSFRICSGRVEAKTQQSTWTTICETDFDWQDGEVVCRELGCGTLLTLQGALYREGTHPFGTKEFQCKGTEKSLLTCSTSSRGEHTCTHGMAAGLTCSGRNDYCTQHLCPLCPGPGDVRLVDGRSRCAGTVEIFHSGEWRKLARRVLLPAASHPERNTPANMAVL
uniref:SRCR domain-containing protein n=1 Tax=Astyanax mexicanus TaxID=7994 RepID=A0A3B1JVE1_ASTMX